jgi:hypothetical protein
MATKIKHVDLFIYTLWAFVILSFKGIGRMSCANHPNHHHLHRFCRRYLAVLVVRVVCGWAWWWPCVRVAVRGVWMGLDGGWWSVHFMIACTLPSRVHLGGWHADTSRAHLGGWHAEDSRTHLGGGATPESTWVGGPPGLVAVH